MIIIYIPPYLTTSRCVFCVCIGPRPSCSIEANLFLIDDLVLFFTGVVTLCFINAQVTQGHYIDRPNNVTPRFQLVCFQCGKVCVLVKIKLISPHRLSLAKSFLISLILYHYLLGGGFQH